MTEEKKQETTAETPTTKQPKAKKVKVEQEVAEVKVHTRREKVNSRWTQNLCQRYAKRFLSREEWESGHPSSFKAAVAHGWELACSAHMNNVKALKKPSSSKPSYKKSA